MTSFSSFPHTAQLGQTDDPTELIPGDAGTLHGTADELHRRSELLSSAADGLRRIDTGSAWTGRAADAFRDTFQPEPRRWDTSSDAFRDAAGALADYAAALTRAQSQAADAIHQWQQADAATDHARHEHAAAQHAAPLSTPPFQDPGTAGRDAAQATLTTARHHRDHAADRAARLITAARDTAPAGPRWWAQLWNTVSDYQAGVWDSVTGMADHAWSVSHVRMITDPAGYVADVVAMTRNAAFAATHPLETARAVIDLDTWRTDPARALGRLAPDLAISIATGGGAGATTRAARSVRTVHQLDPARTPTRHAPDRADYTHPDFETTPADHAAYRDRHPVTEQEHRIVAELRRDNPATHVLSDEELLALKRYTGAAHQDINHALRSGDAEQLSHLQPDIRETASALHRLPDHHGPVQRGIQVDPAQLATLLDRYTPGATIKEPAFTSTDAVQPHDGNVQFVIDSTSGKDISFLSDAPSHTGPREVLFPPGHTFQVQRVEIDPTTQEVRIYLSDEGQ